MLASGWTLTPLDHPEGTCLLTVFPEGARYPVERYYSFVHFDTATSIDQIEFIPSCVEYSVACHASDFD